MILTKFELKNGVDEPAGTPLLTARET